MYDSHQPAMYGGDNVLIWAWGRKINCKSDDIIFIEYSLYNNILRIKQNFKARLIKNAVSIMKLNLTKSAFFFVCKI